MTICPYRCSIQVRKEPTKTGETKCPANQTNEYIAFANEYDELVDHELIPSGLYKGRSLDWDCELNWEQRAAAFVDAQAKEFDRLEALRFDVPESCLPAWASSHENKID